MRSVTFHQTHTPQQSCNSQWVTCEVLCFHSNRRQQLPPCSLLSPLLHLHSFLSSLLPTFFTAFFCSFPLSSPFASLCLLLPLDCRLLGFSEAKTSKQVPLACLQFRKLQLATVTLVLLAFTMSTWCKGFWVPHRHQTSFLSWGRVGRKHILLVLSLRADSITRWPLGWWSASILTLFLAWN